MTPSTDFTLTPIGSCRIVNPIRRAQPYFNFKANFKKIYGFTHTSGEALQQIRFIMGLNDIPEHLQPFIFRPGMKATGAEKYLPSDMYIVEISSQKKIIAFGFCLQINYLTRYYEDFFSKHERARTYWSLAAQDCNEKLEAFLSADSCYADMPEEDRILLRNIRVEQMQEHSIEQDMVDIVELLGKDRVIFMTHIDAMTQSGSTIPSRSRLIRDVQKIADRIGSPCINPTMLMTAWGQNKALEKNGDDLTHYTDLFGDAIVADIFRNEINIRRTSADGLRQEEQSGIQELAAAINRYLKKDDIVLASNQLFAALRTRPNDPILIQLRSLIFCKLGYFEQAYQDVVDAEKIIGITDSTLRCRLKALHGLGQWQEALSTAEKMLSNEIEDEEVLTVAAESTDALELFDKSYQYWQRILMLNPAAPSGWTHYLRSAKYFDNGSSFASVFHKGVKLQGENLQFMETALTLAALLNEDQIYAQALEWLLEQESAHAMSTVSAVPDTGLVIKAALCIKSLNSGAVLSSKFRDKLHAVFVAWNSKAIELSSADDFISLSTSLVYSYSVAIAFPYSHDVGFNNELKSVWRETLKGLYERKEFENITAGARIAWHLLEFDPICAIYCARAFIHLDQHRDAISLSHRTLLRNPNVTSLQAIELRSIRFVDDIPFQVDLISDLMNISQSFLNDSIIQLFRKETVSITTRAIKLVRQKKIEGRFDEALSLLIKLKRIDPDTERLMREYKQIIRLFDGLMKESNTVFSSHENLSYARKLLVFDNESSYALKYVALSLMQLGEYAQALEYWQRLVNVSGPTDSVKRQMSSCQKMLDKNKQG